MNCLEFFTFHSNNRDKCKELQKQAAKIQWQLESASIFSPSIVTDEEMLIRQIILPIHLENDLKTIRPTALDDVFDKGLSVNRLNYKSIEDISDTASKRAQEYNEQYREKPQRSLHSLIAFLTSEVRKLLDHENNIALGVYDTALEQDNSHGDICHLISGKQSQRSIRSKLLDIAKVQ
jgi:hypothetical protein